MVIAQVPMSGQLEADLHLIKQMNGNTVRMHYQAHPDLYDLADRLGLFVWAEIPLWGVGSRDVGEFADPAAIDVEIERKVPPLLAHGGYFPGIDHGLPPTTRHRIYLHFMRRLHELTGNPQGEFWRYLTQAGQNTA